MAEATIRKNKPMQNITTDKYSNKLIDTFISLKVLKY